MIYLKVYNVAVPAISRLTEIN